MLDLPWATCNHVRIMDTPFRIAGTPAAGDRAAGGVMSVHSRSEQASLGAAHHLRRALSLELDQPTATPALASGFDFTGEERRDGT